MIMTDDEILIAIEEYAGYCTECDAVTNDSGVEPDAEEYKCSACGDRTVMGIEQAILLNHIQPVGYR